MSSLSEKEELRKTKLKKQEKKMTKILSKAWSLDNAETFQEVRNTGNTSSTGIPHNIDLSTIGQNLENGAYPLGRKGWETFAAELGFVYNQFLINNDSSNNSKIKLAKQHLNEACALLSKIEPSLANIATNSKTLPTHVSSQSASSDKASVNNDKKRKSALPSDQLSHPDGTAAAEGGHIPKKHATSTKREESASSMNTNTTTTSISQREEKGMKNLINYIVDCGGEKQQLSSFRCKVTQSSTTLRYDISYYNESNRKFRSMVDVARFLNLKTSTDDATSGTAAGGGGGGDVDHNNHSQNNTFVIKQGRPRNIRELEAERKRLRRELDKLVRAHSKATKAVDDFQNERGNDTTPIDDELLDVTQARNIASKSAAAATAISATTDGGSDVMSKNNLLQQSLAKAFELDNGRDFAFDGLPSSCTQDTLMVWDFLCTFSRTLSLEPIDLEHFIAALNYKPLDQSDVASASNTTTTVMKAKNHTGGDGDEDYDDGEAEFGENMDNDPLAIAAKAAPPIYLAEAHLAIMKLLLKDATSDQWWWSILETPELEALETETTGRGEADNIAPTIKVDIVALLDYPDEDVEVTKKWLQALEDVRERRTNSGGAIKSAVKSALSITKNPFVKSYLRKSLQYWQGNAASFTKRSVMWLIGRVREARPDLWGRKIDPDTLNEQKSKVAREATAAMAQLEDAPELDPVDDNLQYGDSDDDESDSDEDENNNMDEETNDLFERNKKGSANMANAGMDEKGINDDTALVTSPVPPSPPPTLVDLLLPPSKPLHSSHIISPFTWPFLAGASVCRIVHRFKRLRNEADDSLREFREVSPLTKKERKEREEKIEGRVFSECVALVSEDNTDSRNKSLLEIADFLCTGGNYLDLSPLERLSLLRVLMEAAYDTVHVHQCVQDNITARKNAITQLEKEERNAKKEAKEAAAALEQDARQRLVQDAINEFLTKKRRELARMNKQTNEFTKDLIESLTVEEIIDMDDENKVEYDALPGPQQFTKAEVRNMVSKITEERAFNTSRLEVLTVEELEAQEGNELSSSRKEAIEVVKEAIEDGTIKALRSAIRLAKSEALCGEDEETGGMWALDSLRDAALELKQAEKRKKVTEAQKDLVAKRNKCFVRTEELGSDRVYNKFWKFGQDLDNRIWVVGDSTDLGLKSRTIGAPDEETDFCPGREDNFVHFSRQEYHSSGFVSSLIMRKCGYLSSSHSLRAILKYLDSRGSREGALKSSLKEIVESYGIGTSDAANDSEMNVNEQELKENEMSSQQNYIATLELYRNKLGRFCGRAADAPYASSALFLSKLMLKREQDCYALLKSRTYDNNWGGKSGARNAWIASMKEYGNDLSVVRDGLLTLEDALFEMCGGFLDEKDDEAQVENDDRKNEPIHSVKELLEKPEARFDLELESSVQKINGLWNSRQSRLVFRAIISSESCS